MKQHFPKTPGSFLGYRTLAQIRTYRLTIVCESLYFGAVSSHSLLFLLCHYSIISQFFNIIQCKTKAKWSKIGKRPHVNRCHLSLYRSINILTYYYFKVLFPLQGKEHDDVDILLLVYFFAGSHLFPITDISSYINLHRIIQLNLYVKYIDPFILSLT